MARERTLKVIIAGDSDKLTKSLKKSGDDLDKFGKHTRLTASITSKGFHGMRLAATGAVGAIGGLSFALKGAVSAASDINESLTKNQALFGKNAKAIEQFAKTTATSLGISRRQALAAAGTFGGLFDAINIGEKQSATMSKRLVTLAADLASFNNASPEEALEALRSGLSGEAEPMRRFNAFLSETRVKAEAASMGIGKTAVDTVKLKNAQLAAEVAQIRYNVAVQRYGVSSVEAKTAQIAATNAQERAKAATKGGTAELTEAQKVQARFSLILKDTAKAHGDFTKTSQGDANQTRILRAQYEDMTSELGSKLLPAKLKVTKALNKFIGEMRDGTGQGGRFVDRLKDIWSEVKPVVLWIGRATKNVAEFASKHPMVAKLAASVIALGLAIKTIKFVSAATGFTDFLKVGRSTVRTLKRTFITGGAEAGAGAAAAAAGTDGLASTKATGKFRSTGRLAGKAFGAGMIIGTVLGLATIGAEASKAMKGAFRKVGLWNPPGGQGSFWDNLIPDTVLPKGGFKLEGPLGKLIKKAVGKGDGIGVPTGIPAGKGSAALRGARSSLAPFAGIGAKFGLSVSSGRRPGSITSSGNVSYHSSGEAIDEAGPAKGMLAYFRYLKSNFGARLAELIYTPGGVGIKNGRPHRYTGQVAADHFDHVHVALDTGKAGVGDGLGKGAIMNLWTRSGGSSSVANLAAAVALAESGGNTNAVNKNKDGSTDRGLWQINSIHGALSTFNPSANARAAVKISSGGKNWTPWVAYTTGRYRQYLGGAANTNGGGITQEAIDRAIEANQKKIDALRTRLDKAPKGLAGAVQRDKLQAQIKSIQADQRGLRGQAKDAPSAAEREEAATKAGSRIINAIARPLFAGKTGITALTRFASERERVIGDKDIAYSQTERRFGQSEEDLGTPGGRRARISELKELARLKGAQLQRQKQELAAVKGAIKKYDTLIKKLRAKLKGPRRAKGATAARIRERLRDYEDARLELAAQARSLGAAIEDTKLDIGDLFKEGTDVAATPDTKVEEGPTPGERTADLTGLIDLQERAGVIDAPTAQAKKIAVLEAALGGQLGPLSERERWQIMGDLKEAQEAGVAALDAATEAIRDLQKSIDDNTNFAKSVMATENAALTRGLADLISGQIAGVGIAGRGLMPGTAGVRARY